MRFNRHEFADGLAIEHVNKERESPTHRHIEKHAYELPLAFYENSPA